MKKTLILASLLAFAASTQVYAADEQTAVPTKAAEPAAIEEQAPDVQKPPKKPGCDKKKAEFEKRLKLTDEQKAQAKEIRMKGHEQMKPVMEKMKQLKEEEQAVRRSKIHYLFWSMCTIAFFSKYYQILFICSF